MSFKFNPITAELDRVGGSGSPNGIFDLANDGQSLPDANTSANIPISRSWTITGGKFVKKGRSSSSSITSFRLENLDSSASLNYSDGGNLYGYTNNGAFAWGIITSTLANGGIRISNSGASGVNWGRLLGYSGSAANPNQLSFQLLSTTARQGVIELYEAAILKTKLEARTNGLLVSSGNIGVGVDPSVDHKLDVNGKVRATDINFSNLPNTSIGLSTGDVWNDLGTLKIV